IAAIDSRLSRLHGEIRWLATFRRDARSYWSCVASLVLVCSSLGTLSRLDVLPLFPDRRPAVLHDARRGVPTGGNSRGMDGAGSGGTRDVARRQIANQWAR